MSSKSNNFWFVAASLILSFLAATILAELVLGIMAKNQRHSVPDYGDVMRPGLGQGGYLQENLTMYVTDGLGGKVRWTNNSKGFRSDCEFNYRRPTGVLRILSLGDSFTSGYRVGQEETFSYLQEKWINRNYGKAEVLVAEIEEPTTALYYLVKFGIKMNPEVVLLGITLGNDIAESYVGLDPKGMYVLDIGPGEVHIEVNKKRELGYTNGLEKYKLTPEYLNSFGLRLLGYVDMWWKRRNLWRLFFPQDQAITSFGDRHPPNLFDINNGFGVFTSPAPAVIDEAYQRLFRILTAFQTFCQPRGILFVTQLFPQRYQVQPDDWERAVNQYGLRKTHFDLMAPNKRIQEFCQKHGIPCLDPTKAMADYAARTGRNLYLPLGDMHWNREGHLAFFQCSCEAFGAIVQQGFQLARNRDAGNKTSQRDNISGNGRQVRSSTWQ